MVERDRIIQLTQTYWKGTDVGFDINSASHGFRFGLVVALRHPEYAQAYKRLTYLPIADPLEEQTVQHFIESVPLVSKEGGNGAREI